MTQKPPDDFLVKRRAAAEEANPADEAVFTFFSPVGEQQRHRFMVTREAGDLLSILPTSEARFKTGLQAWRWDEREGGEPRTYLVTKTKPNRIDLRLVQPPRQDQAGPEAS
jgi:hypothetical protein